MLNVFNGWFGLKRNVRKKMFVSLFDRFGRRKRCSMFFGCIDCWRLIVGGDVIVIESEKF